MALIVCKECNEQISSQAVICPKCGARLRKVQRSFFGKLCKLIFILFNIFMIWAILAGVNNTSNVMNGMSGAEHDGAVIGTGIGIFFYLIMWAAGDIILGLFVLFTRPRND